MSRDGEWTPYDPGPGADEAVGREPTSRRPRPSGAHGVMALLFLVVPLLVVVGGAVWLFQAADGDGDGTAAGVEEPDALSADGLRALRDDVRERSGGTEVFRAVVYPAYAVVDLPIDARSQRSESLHWDGELDDEGTTGTSTYTRIDLALVDARVVTAAVTRARRLVDDPTTWYVVVDGPAVGADDRQGTTITAYASNEFDESASVELALDGTPVARYVSTE